MSAQDFQLISLSTSELGSELYVERCRISRQQPDMVKRGELAHRAAEQIPDGAGAELLDDAHYLLVKAANRLLKPATRPSVFALRSWPV